MPTCQTNCITELLPSRALERAKHLDDYLKANGKPVGPFHGIPISVKEHISMKDLDGNGGFIGWVGNTATQNAHILQILWNAGAIFYVRTTEPQTLMHLETSSNLYGFVERTWRENSGVNRSQGYHKSVQYYAHLWWFIRR
jgi:amidase